jgi:hypothetical protein
MKHAKAGPSARAHAWRVLSAVLSWAANSELVPEIESNGCQSIRSEMLSGAIHAEKPILAHRDVIIACEAKTHSRSPISAGRASKCSRSTTAMRSTISDTTGLHHWINSGGTRGQPY